MPKLESNCKELTVEATLDGQLIEREYAPYVVFDEADMTVKIDPVDCLANFKDLPLEIKYTDDRGSIVAKVALLSLNPNGCNTVGDKFAPILRPYFNVTDSD